MASNRIQTSKVVRRYDIYLDSSNENFTGKRRMAQGEVGTSSYAMYVFRSFKVSRVSQALPLTDRRMTPSVPALTEPCSPASV